MRTRPAARACAALDWPGRAWTSSGEPPAAPPRLAGSVLRGRPLSRNHLSTTMTSADFCIVTPDVAAARAVSSMVFGADSSHAAGSSSQRLNLDIPVSSYAVLSPSTRTALDADLPRSMRELSVHKRRIYRRLRTGGLCCRVPSPTAPLGLDYAVSVRALRAAPGQWPGPSHLLHSGFLRTSPRGIASAPAPAIAFRSWFSLATRCVRVGTPTGDFHPISSRPCRAHQKKAHPGERVGLEALRKKDVVGTGGGSLPCSRYFCSSTGVSNLASWPAELASCDSNEKHSRGRPRQRPSPV